MTISQAELFRRVAAAAAEDGKAAYFRYHRFRFAAMLRAMLQLAPPTAAPRVLEIGVTPGHYTQLLVGAGYHVSGSDLDPHKRAALWQRLNVEVTNINLEREALPYADQSFDWVVFSEVIEHLRFSPLPLLCEFRRVLKPGGRLIISTPNELYLKSRLRTILRALSWQSLSTRDEYRTMMALVGDDIYTTHARIYTMAELQWLFVQAGFTLELRDYEAAYEWVGVERSRLLRAPHRVLVKALFALLTHLLVPTRSMLLVVGQRGED
jgi:SAM-dependent methyltransferase